VAGGGGGSGGGGGGGGSRSGGSGGGGGVVGSGRSFSSSTMNSLTCNRAPSFCCRGLHLVSTTL